MSFVVGIDASRNRSGGAINHLIGILSGDLTVYGITSAHVWSYKELLEQLPESPRLMKHNPPALEQSIFHQIWWQRTRLPVELSNQDCNIVLNTDSGTVCRFRPNIVISQDMLSFEKGEIKRYPLVSRQRLRLILLRYITISSFRQTDGALFLSNYAAKTIQCFTGKLKQSRIVPHGVDTVFISDLKGKRRSLTLHRPIRCLYVSNAAMHKHQWSVIEAVAKLRNAGQELSLTLVGGGVGRAQRIMENAIRRVDPQGAFIRTLGAVKHEKISFILSRSDIFIFASSCENMPITLIEAMASGVPIACSDRGPMPEVLQDGGLYFNPEDPDSIAMAVKTMLDDHQLRLRLSKRSQELSSKFSWEKCARETWQFLVDIYRNLSNISNYN